MMRISGCRSEPASSLDKGLSISSSRSFEFGQWFEYKQFPLVASVLTASDIRVLNIASRINCPRAGDRKASCAAIVVRSLSA